MWWLRSSCGSRVSSSLRGAPPPLLHVPTLGHRPPSQCARCGAVGHILTIFIHTHIFLFVRVLVLSIGETVCYTRVLLPRAILEVTLIRLGERCVLIVRVLGCTSSAASLTVISLSWPIISWISDATMDVLWVCIFGFVFFGCLCASGGDVSWPSSTAVVFVSCLMYLCITASYGPAHH